MLCLSRKREQIIIIGDGENAVEVKVLEILPDRVRLGITAPREMPVNRGEVHEKILEGRK